MLIFYCPGNEDTSELLKELKDIASKKGYSLESFKPRGLSANIEANITALKVAGIKVHKLKRTNKGSMVGFSLILVF